MRAPWKKAPSESLLKWLGLDLSEEDEKDLSQGPREEMTTEDLQDCWLEQQQTVGGEIPSEEGGERTENVTYPVIKFV